MKIIHKLDQTTTLAVGSFTVAALMLVASIAAAKIGNLQAARLLINIAGPICAFAMATLAHLAFARPQPDPEA